MVTTDGRSRKERIKKWIKEQTEFGKKFKIHPKATKMDIKMRLAGYESVAGLDKKGIKSMGYDKNSKVVIKKYPKSKDYFIIWKKTKRKPY